MLILSLYFFFFFFNDTATTEIYTLSLHDALPIFTGRPVKWVGDRREDLLTSTQAWDETIDAELAVDADGTIHALRARVVADVGAYSIHPWTASIEVVQVISFLPGPYRVPHYRGEAWGRSEEHTSELQSR